MSNSDNVSQNNFEVIEQSFKNYFVDVEHSVPRFQQELFDLQNEYYKAWKNIINTNMLLQKIFVNETGFTLPENSKKILENINEQMDLVRSIRNQIFIATINATKKNIPIWNNNAINLENLNKSLIKYWTSFFAKNQN